MNGERCSQHTQYDQAKVEEACGIAISRDQTNLYGRASRIILESFGQLEYEVTNKRLAGGVDFLESVFAALKRFATELSCLGDATNF